MQSHSYHSGFSPTAITRLVYANHSAALIATSAYFRGSYILYLPFAEKTKQPFVTSILSPLTLAFPSPNQKRRKMANQSLQGKTAIVTGASRGIGKGIAIELATRGANILLTYNSSREQAVEVAAEIQRIGGVDALAVEAMASDPCAPRAIVHAATERWGASCIDIIINNAGAREDFVLEEMTAEGFDRQVAVNLRFPLFLIKEAAAHFGPAPRIVNISSVYARDGQPGCLAYVACKGGMESVTRSLAKELGHKYHATINCVCPGPVNTGLWEASIQDPEMKQHWDHVVRNTPAAPRVAEVDDIAQIVAFLSEEGSRWTTGSLINANGGLLFV